jgi:hypothetical protein
LNREVLDLDAAGLEDSNFAALGFSLRDFEFLALAAGARLEAGAVRVLRVGILRPPLTFEKERAATSC